MCKNPVEPGTCCQRAFHRPTAFLSVVAVSLGLTGLGSVIVSVPQAAAAEATAFAQGSYTDELASPDTMEFTAAGPEIAAVDDQTWDSENIGPTASPYQAFEVQHPGEFAPVSWTGVVDPSREVTLLAWNYETGAWDQLRSESGAAPENTVLEAYLSEDYANEAGQTHLAVIGEDGHMSGADEWAPDEFGVTNEFADPADYDFSIAHVTDTQFLSEGAVDPELDAVGQQRFAEAYRAQMDWIVDNEDARKISYVAHTGDIIENWMLPHHPEEQAREEFEFASEMQSIIDDAGIPNGIIPGNHDNGWGTFGNDMFNDYFPAERYEEASANWDNASYGGPWEEGDNSAHYDLFDVEGHEFIAVYLPYGHNTAQRNWANEILQAFPDRDAFLFTHAYLRASSNADASKAIGNIGYGDNGHLLRTQVVEENDNLVMVSSGHYHGTTWNQNFNGDGGPVFEMLGDYQNYEVGGERNTGFMRLLQFDVDAGEVKVNSYSPKLNEMGATGYDPEGRYIEATDEYTAPLSLSTRGTTLMTDQVRVGDQDESVTEPPEREETPEPTDPPTEPEPEPQPEADLVIEQQADVTVTAGTEIEPITVAVNDEDANVEFSELPAGLVGVPDGREITGIPEAAGDYPVTVTATDQFGREQQMSFTITVEDAPAQDEPQPEPDPTDEPQPEPEPTDEPTGDPTGEPTDAPPVDPVGDVGDNDTGNGSDNDTDTAGPSDGLDDGAGPSTDDDEQLGSGTADEDTRATSFGDRLANTGAGSTTVLVLSALALLGLGTGAIMLHRRKQA